MRYVLFLLLALMTFCSASAAMRPTPDYLKRAVVYQVVLRNFTREGDFRAATEMLGHVRSLGVDVVYLAPFVEMDVDPDRRGWSPRQVASGYESPKNMYRISNYDRIDPEYGSDEDFKRFNDRAHELGMKVYMDLVYLHCGPNNVLKDLFDDAFQKTNGVVRMTYWRFPYVNFESKGVRKYLIDSMKHWMRLGCDGFRCDVGDEIPVDFWVEAVAECQKTNPELVMINEGIKPEWLEKAFDACYAWPWSFAVRGLLSPSAPTHGHVKGRTVSEKMSEVRAYESRIPQDSLMFCFLDNHDTAADDKDLRFDRVRPVEAGNAAFALTFLRKGLPLIYNGNEIADNARNTFFAPVEHPARAYKSVDWSRALQPCGQARLALVRQLAKMRHEDPIWTEGDMTWVTDGEQDGIVAFVRELNGRKVLVAANLQDRPANGGTLIGCLQAWEYVIREVGSLAQAVPNTNTAYGVCAHVTRSERNAHRLSNTIRLMEHANIRYVRSDFDAGKVRRTDGSYDFSDYDSLVAELEAQGLRLLPILYGAGKEKPVQDLKGYESYVKTVVSHFRNHVDAVEVWNEANLESFFVGADPEDYARVLKVAYRAVKSVDPSIRVVYTGVAGVPLNWIRKTLEVGAGASFDVMNIHPYSHPHRPEDSLLDSLRDLRRLMGEFHVEDKPVWITEIGWPTQSVSVPFGDVICAGLKVARPEQKCWNAVLADCSVDGKMSDQSRAQELERILPAGSRVVRCNQKETLARLAAGDVDLVIYPFDETFPADTIEAVNDFIRKGGVLVDTGGLPCYFGQRGGMPDPGMQHGAALKDFPFGYQAWWRDPTGTCPKECQAFATEAGRSAGVRQEPTGFRATRFLKPERAGNSYDWIPLVSAKDRNGKELVAATVIRYHGERTGAAVLSTLRKKGTAETTDEENQARYLVRALAMSMADGVEAVFPYNLRALEEDPYYSEHHFGLVHANFVPKPAYSAYAAFIRERPAGSVAVSGDWRDARGRLFYPQWVRPDGVRAGMIWSLGGENVRELSFRGTPEFRNMYGRKIPVQNKGDGNYVVSVSESPIYYSGGDVISCKDTSSAPRLPKLVAHRGAADLTMPEASRAAYSNAVARASDIVKLDLQMTKDRVVVMGHDPTLLRNMGWDARIAELDYDEIRRKGRFKQGKGYSDESIVTLEESLAIVRGAPEFWLDFKYFDPEFAEKVLALVSRAGIDQSRLMVATYNTVALTYFKKNHPNIRRVLHVNFLRNDEGKLRLGVVRDVWFATKTEALAYAKNRYGLHGVNLPVSRTLAVRMMPEEIAEAKNLGLWTALWFVQDADLAAEYLPSAADAFVTDYTTKVRKAFGGEHP